MLTSDYVTMGKKSNRPNANKRRKSKASPFNWPKGSEGSAKNPSRSKRKKR